MDDDALLTEASLDANSRFIIPFASRKFRQRIFFPPNVLAVLPSLVHSVVTLHERPETLPQALEALSSLKSSSASPRFSSSLDEVTSRLQTDGDLPRYVWELASDLVLFYHEVLALIDSSLAFAGQTNALVKRELGEIPRYLDAIASGRPPTARDSVPVSLRLGTPEVMRQYEPYARSQSQLVRKCDVCGDPASWFAYPCSHAVYCDDCRSECDGDGSAATQCPTCEKPIAKLVRIQFPE
jgi:hypothetical protein